MSELIAEARVLVTPDTGAFRQLLVTQVNAAAQGVTVPVQVVPASTTATAASLGAVARQQREVTAAQVAGASAARSSADAQRRLVREEAAHVRQLSQLSRGAGATALTFAGLRGATLAATGPFLAGTAAATAFAKSIQLATSFNSQIAVLGATTGAAGQDMEQAAQAAREFGRDISLPGVTAADAAQTITEFAKAGLSLNESIAATRGGLQLAQAAQLSYADAVTLSANALNAFGLSGNQAVRVADTLANAANLAQGGIADTALALRQAAAAAQVVGVSFEDTTALLTLLARNGLTGSDAGTALRTAFLRLVNPSKEAAAILKDLNVQLRDANGNVRPEVFADFANAQRDLSTATQQANAAIVFGQDAFRAFGILGREGRVGLQEVTRGLEQTGTAARIAQARMTGLAGAQENLSNQLNDLGLTVGNFVDGPLAGLISGLGEYIGFVNNATQDTLDFTSALNEFGPGPSTTDLLGRIDFGAAVQAGLSNLNPALAGLFRFRDLFDEGSKDTANTIKNGGVELRSAIEDASREAARGAVSFGDQITDALQTAFSAVNNAIAQASANARNQALRSVRQGGGQASGLEEQFNSILAGGGDLQQQIANLQRQAAVQARIIRDAGPNAAGTLLEARREAQAKLASINQQRVALEQQIASDAAAAAQERKRIQEQAARDADEALLSQQDAARTAAQRRVTVAEDTPSLRDDIARTRALRTLLLEQIQQVRARITDEKAEQAAVQALQAQVFTTTQAIRRLRQEEQKQREENRQAIFDQRAENAALRTQIAEARDADKSVIVRFIDQEIAVARQALRRARQAGKGILAATLAVEELRKKKRDLLDQAREEAQSDTVGGTSLVDLFTQAERIASGAGNVGGINAFNVRAQPRIQAEVQQRLDIVNDPAAARAARQERSTDRLIAAIDQLTAAITGNGVAGVPVIGGGQNRRGLSRNLTQEQRFYNQRTARQMVEQGLVG